MRYNVLVKPGSSRDSVEKIDEESLVVRTHARAHDNEANIAVIKLLASYFNVAKSSVKVTRGTKSRRKVVEIE